MKIYIGNLPPISDSAIKDLFAPFGTVQNVYVNKSKNSFRPRFFAFVEMDRKEEAYDAISELKSKSLEGNKLVIMEVTGKK